jgi:hypothetical protein
LVGAEEGSASGGGWSIERAALRGDAAASPATRRQPLREPARARREATSPRADASGSASSAHAPRRRQPSVVRRNTRLQESVEVAVRFDTPTLGFTLQSTADDLRPAIISEFSPTFDGAPGPAATSGQLSIGDSISRVQQRPVVSSFMYRYILRESCSQFDLLPLTSLTISSRPG